ncbi:MAG: hypothetical protein Q4Q03_06455 [Bowdeniella nasicola]|nr:hypothetical protein [Bowdeniella nasicola]
MKKLIAIFAATVLAASLSACGSDDSPEQQSPTSSEVATSQASEAEETTQAAEDSKDAPAASSQQLPESATAAVDTVLAEYPGTLIGLDAKDDGWKVKVLTEDETTKVDVRTNADGSEIVKVEHEHEAHPNDVERVKAIEVGLLEAIDQAMSKYPGEFDEADLDNDDDYVYWEIEINNAINGEDAEVQVNISNGEMKLDD